MVRTAASRTWVEIKRDAIASDYRALRSVLPNSVKSMAVVKSNAYGHGMVSYAKELDALGADWFGVDSLEEGVALRRSGIKKPILVFGFTPFPEFSSAAEEGISLTVSNRASLEFLKTYRGKELKIHVKVDTGLHRQGFSASDLPQVLSALNDSRGASRVEGLYTHFATAEDPASSYSQRQLEEFAPWREAFARAGLSALVHAAGTAAGILIPESRFDMVRFGIGLYGLWPSKAVEERSRDTLTLTPVLSWKSIIGDVKRVRKGERVGYDLTEKLSRDSVLAVCGVGYWHGFPRSLSGKGVVGVRGKGARVVGRVSMDMIVLDVTDIPGVATGDEAVLIGESGGTRFSAEALAEAAGTINYEIVTRINRDTPRFYI